MWFFQDWVHLTGFLHTLPPNMLSLDLSTAGLYVLLFNRRLSTLLFSFFLVPIFTSPSSYFCALVSVCKPECTRSRSRVSLEFDWVFLDWKSRVSVKITTLLNLEFSGLEEWLTLQIYLLMISGVKGSRKIPNMYGYTGATSLFTGKASLFGHICLHMHAWDVSLPHSLLFATGKSLSAPAWC